MRTALAFALSLILASPAVATEPQMLRGYVFGFASLIDLDRWAQLLISGDKAAAENFYESRSRLKQARPLGAGMYVWIEDEEGEMAACVRPKGDYRCYWVFRPWAFDPPQ
jgi:hypothetical protein